MSHIPFARSPNIFIRVLDPIYVILGSWQTDLSFPGFEPGAWLGLKHLRRSGLLLHPPLSSDI